MLEPQFDPEKALETLVYVCARMPRNDMYRSLKAIYIADKLHLQRYGRLIYGEAYAALPYGATPQAAYDAVRALKGERSCAIPHSFLFAALERMETSIKPLREPDLETLSITDVECLDEAIRACAFSFDTAKALAHDDAWKATSPTTEIPLSKIIDTFPDDRKEAVRAYLDRC